MKQKIDLFMLSMNIKENKNFLIRIMVLLCFGLFFYMLNFYTPKYVDDWHYQFIFGTTDRILSILDILSSQYIHYFEINGLFISHFFAHLFVGILWKARFNFINNFFFFFFFVFIV